MSSLTLRDWKDITETVEHLAVALGVTVGGFWTLFTFHRLKLVANALLDIKEKEKNIAKKEQELHESAVLEASIRAEQLSVDDKNSFYISAVVSVVNVGNVDTYIKYEETQFVAFEVNFGENGTMTYANATPGRYPDPLDSNLVGTTIPPRFSKRIPYIFKVKKPGLFLIVFRAKAYGEVSAAVTKLINEDAARTAFCRTESFVVVKEPGGWPGSRGVRDPGMRDRSSP